MSALIKLNIRDEIHAELIELAKQDGISVGSICNYAITDFVSSYSRLKNPLPKSNINKSAKEDPEFFSSLYESVLADKRIKNAKRKGNIIQIS